MPSNCCSCNVSVFWPWLGVGGVWVAQYCDSCLWPLSGVALPTSFHLKQKKLSIRAPIYRSLQALRAQKGSFVGSQPAPCRGLSGPPGPKCRKSLENVSWGLRPRDPKSLKKVSGTVREVSRESPESVWRVFLECSGTFWRLFGVPGRRHRETFSRLFRHLRARETSARGGLAPKSFGKSAHKALKTLQKAKTAPQKPEKESLRLAPTRGNLSGSGTCNDNLEYPTKHSANRGRGTSVLR